MKEKKPVDLSHVPDITRERFKDYHAKFQGRIMFSQLCTASGVTDLSVLPPIQKYVKDGKNNLCYSKCLGICPHEGRGCHFMHATKAEQDETFCTDLCDKLEVGMSWMIKNAHNAPGGNGRGRGRGQGRKRKGG